MSIKLLIEVLLPLVFLAGKFDLWLLVIMLLFIIWWLIGLIEKGYKKFELKIK